MPVGGPQLLCRALSEGLRERVDVGPAEALGAGAAVVDQQALDPLDASGFGIFRDGLWALLAVHGAGILDETTQGVGLARR